MAPGDTGSDDDDSVATELQEVSFDEVKYQVTETLTTIPQIVRVSVEQYICAATIYAQQGICMVGYESGEQGVLTVSDQLCLERRLKKHFDKYFKADKPTKSLGKRLLCNDEILAPKPSFVQNHNEHAFTDQRRVGVFVSTVKAPEPRKMRLWKQTPILCTNHHVVRVVKAVVRRSTKVVSHAKPATTLLLVPAKTGTIGRASRTLQCERMTPTPSEKSDPAFMYHAQIFRNQIPITQVKRTLRRL